MTHPAKLSVDVREASRGEVMRVRNPFLYFITRLLSWRKAAPSPTPSELEFARFMREAARARYLDAVARQDKRDIGAYEPQFVRATNHVLTLEAGRAA